MQLIESLLLLLCKCSLDRIHMSQKSQHLYMYKHTDMKAPLKMMVFIEGVLKTRVFAFHTAIEQQGKRT